MAYSTNLSDDNRAVKPERVLMEAVLIELTYDSGICLKEIGKRTKMCHYSQYLDLGFNRTPSNGRQKRYRFSHFKI